MLVTLTEHHVLTPFGRDLHCRTCSALQRTPGWLVILTFFLKLKYMYVYMAEVPLSIFTCI